MGATFHQSDQFHVSGRWNAGVWPMLFSHKTFLSFFFSSPSSFFFFFNLFFILVVDLVTGHDMLNYLEDQIQVHSGIRVTHQTFSSPRCHFVSLSPDCHGLPLCRGKRKKKIFLHCPSRNGVFGN